jgi:hypothetical protein
MVRRAELCRVEDSLLLSVTQPSLPESSPRYFHVAKVVAGKKAFRSDLFSQIPEEGSAKRGPSGKYMLYTSLDTMRGEREN